MRLLHTFKDDRNARTFSSFLTQQGIENQLDLQKNSDWGSDDYGTISGRVWVIDEDDLEKSQEFLNTFTDNPNDQRFSYLKPSTVPPEPPEASAKPSKKDASIKLIKRASGSINQPLGPATFYTILGCIVLFFLSVGNAPSHRVGPSNGLPHTPLYSSPINKPLYYDYPEAYEIVDKVIKAYGIEKLTHPNQLPSEGKILLQQYAKTPYWRGFYEKFIAYLKSQTPITVTAPLFEKIREGELWRLITPVFMHNDIFHIFFNMMALLVLGKQMEKLLGIPRYFFFMLLTGIFSNTMQYLMSGSNFIGYSGILCAMIMFVWTRQKNTPWEGYQLLPASMKFVVVFILGIAVIQLASFIMEVNGTQSFALGIANTAHLSGALSGYLLAKLNFFSRKKSGPT